MPKRIFLSILLPEETRQALENQLIELNIPGKVVPSENWHLTLQFLGYLEDTALKRLNFILNTLNLGKPFSLSLGKFSAFPKEQSAKILWLGIEEGLVELTLLANVISNVLVQEGYAIDTRRYLPHLTLSRFFPPRNIMPWLEAVQPPTLSFRVDKVVLYESIPKEGKASHYFPLAEYRLNNPIL